MERRWFFLLGLAVVVALAAATRERSATAAGTGKPDITAKVRVGVYDSRAIAVAWASSSYNPVGEKRAELEMARRQGNTAKVQELEAWGPAHQRLLHFQGFGRVPVDDLLVPVRKGVAEIARKKGLSAVAMQYEYKAPGVETVDITAELVELYRPSERTRQTVREMRKVKPLGLLELADMKEND